MIFHKQRGEARTKIAVQVILRIGSYKCEAVLSNASATGVLATLRNPPVRGTKVELVIGEHVLPGQVRWREWDCCGIALRDKINVAELLEGGEVSLANPSTRAIPRVAKVLLRSLGRG